jgi:hypothetical protein
MTIEVKIKVEEDAIEIWRNTDPRYLINKWADIVIIRPSTEGRGKLEAGIGHVSTKECWSIWTPFENYKYISVDDKWNTDWSWTWAPNKKV